MAPHRTPQPEPAKGRTSPCLLCGGDSFIWGTCMPVGAFKFKPDNASWWVKNTVHGGSELRARACQTCGNIQLFTKQ
jgi:hypothetical protein